MMIEDKLDKDQRLRLDCVNQARMMVPTDHERGQSVTKIIEKAAQLEKYVTTGKVE